MNLSIFEAGFLVWIQENLRAPVLNEIMVFITKLGDGGVFWIVVALALLVFKKTRKAGIQCAVAMLLTLLVVNAIMKPSIARTRPYDMIEGLNILISPSHDFSFPSGHTANSFSCAWVMLRRLPKKFGVPALVLALLISFSRLYIGVHFPSDVLGGALIAIILAEIGMFAFGKIEKEVLKARKAK